MNIDWKPLGGDLDESRLAEGFVSGEHRYDLDLTTATPHLHLFENGAHLTLPYASADEAKAAAQTHLETGVLPRNEAKIEEGRARTQQFLDVTASAQALIDSISESMAVPVGTRAQLEAVVAAFCAKHGATPEQLRFYSRDGSYVVRLGTKEPLINEVIKLSANDFVALTDGSGYSEYHAQSFLEYSDYAEYFWDKA